MKSFAEMQRPTLEAMKPFFDMQKPTLEAMQSFVERKSRRWRQ